MAKTWRLAKAFDFEGERVAYDTMGRGPPLVMVHGTPFSSYAWHRIALELSGTYQVFVYDLLGYGQSEMRDGQDASLGVQNRVLAGLLRYWRLERPFALCHDFGAATVLRAHLIDGCELAKILMFDVVAIRPWGSPFVQHVRRHEAAFSDLPAYLHRAMLAAYIRGAVHRAVTDAELGPYLAPWLGAIGQRAFYRQIAQMDERFTDEIETRLGEMRCPVALLWGIEDEWIPIAQGRKLAQMIPDCTFTEIANAGHLMQEDAPEAIVAAAIRFFSDGRNEQ